MKSEGVVLLTGSSGLIGSALICALAGRFRLIGFDREGPPHPPPEAECISVDLTSDASVRTAFERVRAGYAGRIASVVHLAAYYDFVGAPSPLYEEITVRGTERLLRALAAFEVEQFVFSSSMLVHAPSRNAITESSPLGPTWAYPASKVRAEERIRALHGKIPVALLRIAGVYDDAGHSIPLARHIQRIAEHRLTSRFHPGDPSSGQAFVHLDDLVDALVRVIDRRATLPPETTLLIGEPEASSFGQLQRILSRQLLGHDLAVYPIPKVVAKVGAWLGSKTGLGDDFIKPWMIDRVDDHYALDITRARELLGWEPRRRLHATLPLMVRRLRTDPERWYRENHLDLPRRTVRGWLALPASGAQRNRGGIS